MKLWVRTCVTTCSVLGDLNTAGVQAVEELPLAVGTAPAGTVDGRFCPLLGRLTALLLHVIVNECL